MIFITPSAASSKCHQQFLRTTVLYWHHKILEYQRKCQKIQEIAVSILAGESEDLRLVPAAGSVRFYLSFLVPPSRDGTGVRSRLSVRFAKAAKLQTHTQSPGQSAGWQCTPELSGTFISSRVWLALFSLIFNFV